jgi:hypothetical protein
MYSLFLTLHSLFRWVVILTAIAALVQAFRGWLGRRAWTPLDDLLGLFFTVSLDIQLLLGIILYVVSPLIQNAFQDLGEALASPSLAFFAVEHVVAMFIAVVLAHVGRALARRAEDPQVKHQRAAIFFGLAVVVILIAIPWPFLPYGRPLFRLGA